MRNLDPDRSIHRVLVLLDVTSDHAAALDAAAALATGLDAQLVALFAEDQQLNQLECHPLVRAIDLPTGMGRSIGPGTMRHGWKALVRRTQRRLMRLSQRHQLEVGVEFVRGNVSTEIGKYIRRADLLVVESAGRCVTHHVRLRSKGHVLAHGLSGPVLFAGPRTRELRSAALLYNRTSEAQRGLEMALRLAADRPIMLTLILAGDSDRHIRELEQWATKRVREIGARISLHVRRITCCETTELIEVATNVHANLVMVPDSSEYPTDEDIERLTARLNCPLLLLRGGDEEGRETMMKKVTQQT